MLLVLPVGVTRYHKKAASLIWDSRLTFTSGPVVGKRMIVQAVHSGTDLSHDQYDIFIPGGGQGNTKGCVLIYLNKFQYL